MLNVPKSVLSLAALALVSGCSAKSDSSPLPKLSESMPTENARALALSVKRLCVHNSKNSEEFAAALRNSGWVWRQAQSIDPKNPQSLEVWNGAGIQVIRGDVVADQVHVCTLAVKDALAPSVSQVVLALSKISNTTADAESEWWWNSAFGYKSHMSLGEATMDDSKALAITVETYRLNWFESLIGQLGL